MSPHTESAGRRLVNWLRAGRPEGIAQGDYIALMGVLHRKLTTAEVENIAVSLVERDYDVVKNTARHRELLLRARRTVGPVADPEVAVPPLAKPPVVDAA